MRRALLLSEKNAHFRPPPLFCAAVSGEAGTAGKHEYLRDGLNVIQVSLRWSFLVRVNTVMPPPPPAITATAGHRGHGGSRWWCWGKCKVASPLFLLEFGC